MLGLNATCVSTLLFLTSGRVEVRRGRRDNEAEVEVVTRPVVQGGILRTNREHVVSSKMDCRSPVS